jgi:polyferredoxin
LFCPLGAIYGILNWVSFFFVRFHPEECNDCDRCKTLCRYHGRGERRGGDMRCIRCLDCTRCTAVTLSTVFQRRRKSVDEPQLVNIEQDGENDQGNVS